MNESQVIITGVEFNCVATAKGVYHVIHITLPTPPISDTRTSQLYGAYTGIALDSS